MPWTIAQASVDLSQNRAVVAFHDPGGNDAYPRNVEVAFSLVDPGQPVPVSIDLSALVGQAKQVLADAAKNAPDTAAVAPRP